MCEKKKGETCIYTLCRTVGLCCLTGRLCTDVHKDKKNLSGNFTDDNDINEFYDNIGGMPYFKMWQNDDN